jgi:hypothetical protein
VRRGRRIEKAQLTGVVAGLAVIALPIPRGTVRALWKLGQTGAVMEAGIAPPLSVDYNTVSVHDNVNRSAIISTTIENDGKVTPVTPPAVRFVRPLSLALGLIASARVT